MAKVTVIPSTINPLTQLPNSHSVLKKVAAYARVSTNSDEQYTSYEAQVNYYKKFIQEKPDWTFTKVYADEGISGTSTKKRIKFNQMIKDALNGEIDLIITKSISRFARNTLDTISYVRKLKVNGIEVYFEKENLWSLDPKSELILTIMASIAQEESRSISQNVTWGKRVSFQKGKVSFAYERFLGYKKVGDKLVIDEDQAVIVRLIYRLFLVEGKTATGIAKYLKLKRIKTPSGKSVNWQKNIVNSILTNEKYKGDALLQKTYTVDYLNHTTAVNNGQIPQYYVENNHPAIIDKETWEQVQVEIERRNLMGAKYSSRDVFSSKLICKDCGGYYGRKIWHAGSKYVRAVYQCNHRYHKKGKKCQTPHVVEKDIKKKFIHAYNKTMKDKERIIQDSNEAIELLTATTELDVEINKIDEDLMSTSIQANKLVKDNSKTSIISEDYSKMYDKLSNKYDQLKGKQEELLKIRKDKQSKAVRMKAFIVNLEKSESYIKDWNERIWMLLVESATIHRSGSITFKFNNGLSLNVR